MHRPKAETAFVSLVVTIVPKPLAYNT
jgi:hypothetical protein